LPDEHSDLERLLSEHGLGAPPEDLLQGLGPILKPGGCDMVRRKIEGGAAAAPALPGLRLSEEGAEITVPDQAPGDVMVLRLSFRRAPGETEVALLHALAWALGAESERLACRRLVRELEEKDREREEERERWLRFFYVTVHDLKAPVSAVLNYLKTILRKGTAGMDERLVNMVRRSIIRLDGMLDLISGLLELARLESGADEPFAPVDLEELLGSCSELAHELAMPKDVRVGLSIKRPLPVLRGSELRLNQMLMNLLSNAVRYTPGGGRVKLRAGREGDELVIRVEDNGVGIPPEHLDRVFEEFYRANPAEEGGTGLGLSIARRIAEMHGGRIELESPITPEGGGTRATVRLPLGAADPEISET